MRLLALSILALSLGACAHVHSFNQDTILGGEGNFIETVGEKTVWFNFNFNSDFIDEAREKFMSECPDGQINGVSSRLSSENSFLHWTSRVRFTGYCKHDQRETNGSADTTAETSPEADRAINVVPTDSSLLNTNPSPTNALTDGE